MRIAKTKPAAALATADPDLVDRIFEFLADDPRLPRMDALVLAEVKTDMRREFRGEECYIASRPASARQELACEVLRLFNGRNATELARTFAIGRTTVYRILKQAGGRARAAAPYRLPAEDRPSFPGNGTTPGLPSADD